MGTGCAEWALDVAVWVLNALSGYQMWCVLADMHAEMASSHRARDATLAAIVLGIMLALCLLVGLALCIVMNHRRRKQGGLEEGAAGKASPGGSGTPALGVPIFFATKRDGLGTPGDHKQPPSPIQGFTEVTIPVSSRTALAPLKHVWASKLDWKGFLCCEELLEFHMFVVLVRAMCFDGSPSFEVPIFVKKAS